MMKSLAFSLSILLHLGLLCSLGLVFFKPAAHTGILEINLASWRPTAAPPESKRSVPVKAPAAGISRSHAPIKPRAVQKTTPVKSIPVTTNRRHPPPPSPRHLVRSSAPAAEIPETGNLHGTATENGPPVTERGSANSLTRSYFSTVLARIEAAKHYPPSAVRRHIEGNVIITFRLDPEGHLLSNKLKSSSGFHMLDQAAMEAIENASPFPKFPLATTFMPQSLSVTVSFVLTRSGG